MNIISITQKLEAIIKSVADLANMTKEDAANFGYGVSEKAQALFVKKLEQSMSSSPNSLPTEENIKINFALAVQEVSQELLVHLGTFNLPEANDVKQQIETFISELSKI